MQRLINIKKLTELTVGITNSAIPGTTDRSTLI